MIKLFRKIRQKMLNENRFSKYMFYAVGEVILVVIGILIALQIGDLNERKKKAEKAKIQIESLERELKNDLESMNIDLAYISKELEINNAYAERLSIQTSSLDTLVNIVRYEFSGPFNKLSELNKTTFNSLESTGEIDLLGADLAKNIKKYYINRDNVIVATTTNTNIYFNLLEPFMLKYPEHWFAIQGPLQDSYWRSVDKQTLFAEFNGLLTVRLFNLNVRKALVAELIDKTEKLIDELEF